MLSQAKVDLAVLYWLWDLAEHDAQPPTPSKLAGMFPSDLFSLRRIEVALAELESRGQVECIPYPSEGVYRWQITRDGLGVVDRALKLPNTFIARIAADPNWIKSDEAEMAVLAKLPRTDAKLTSPTASKPDDLSIDRAIHIHNNVSSSNTNTLHTSADGPTDSNSSTRANWFSGWVALASALIALAALVLAFYQAKAI